ESIQVYFEMFKYENVHSLAFIQSNIVNFSTIGLPNSRRTRPESVAETLYPFLPYTLETIDVYEQPFKTQKYKLMIDVASAINQYFEKKWHDAITFYDKAARHPKIKPFAEFLLWEIRRKSTIPSVQIRLKAFDLTTGSPFVKTLTAKDQPYVVTPIFNESNLY